MRNDIPVEEQKGTKKWCEPKIGDIIKKLYIEKRKYIFYMFYIIKTRSYNWML